MWNKLKIFFSMSVLVLLLACSVSVQAQDLSGNTAPITGSCGEEATYTLDADGTMIISGSGFIEQQFNELSIASDIKHLVIQDGITYISPSAFANCTNLMDVTFPQNEIDIASYAFQNCISMESLTIPANVTNIFFCAFEGCSSLSNVVIAEEVTEIDEFVFNGTPWLEAKQAENPLVVVNGRLIDGSQAQGNVTVPEGVTRIGDFAFCWNSEITGITIPESVTSIGWSAFLDCSNLSEVVIPQSVTLIEGRAFHNTRWLEAKQTENPLVVVNGILIDGTTAGENVVIPKNVSTITYWAFYECSGVKSIAIPKTVTCIESDAFDDCTGLTTIYYEGTRQQWEELTAIYFGDDVTIYYEQQIGDAQEVPNQTPSPAPNQTPTPAPTSKPEAKGTSLKSVNITTTDGQVPQNATFTVTNSDPANPTASFDGVADENAKAVKIPKTITYNGVTYKVTTVSPKAYTSQGEEAKFKVTDNRVESLTVTYTAPTNKKKTKVTIPDYSTYKGIKFKVTKVSAKSFKNNKKLKTISIATSITDIGADAFSGCTNLQTVTIGKSLKTIGNNAFKNCKKLTKITIKSTRLKTVGKSALKGVNAKCVIKVPKAKLSKYKKLFKNKGQKKTVKITK